MKIRLSFPIIFITANIFFIFLLIFNKSWITQLSYEQQRLEKEISNLEHQKDALNHELYQQQKPSAIKSFATKKLNMSKIKINQVKKY